MSVNSLLAAPGRFDHAAWAVALNSWQIDTWRVTGVLQLYSVVLAVAPFPADPGTVCRADGSACTDEHHAAEVWVDRMGQSELFTQHQYFWTRFAQ